MNSRLKSYPLPKPGDKYYIQYKYGGKKITKGYTRIPKSVYYASGYHDPSDKGKAFVGMLTDDGTALCPLISAKTGKQYSKRKR